MVVSAHEPAVEDPAPARGAIFTIASWLGYLFVFSTMFVPTTYTAPRAALAALVFGAVVMAALYRGYLPVHPTIRLWAIFMVAVSLFFILRGMVTGAPGALRVATVYVAWPIAFTVLIGGTADHRILRGLLRVLIVATIAISLYGLIYIFTTAGLLPGWLYIPLDQGQGLGLADGDIEVNLYSLASLLFLMPFSLGALVLWQTEDDPPVRRRWLWAALMLSLPLVLLSGRRALQLVAGLSLGIAVGLMPFLPAKERARSRKFAIRIFALAILALGGFAIYLQHALDIDLGAIVASFNQGFDFQSDVSARIRSDQFFALLHGWTESPILGAGHGAGAKEFTRSNLMQWGYELSYMALLFQTGIIGFLAYASGIVWIYWMGIRMMRSSHPLGKYMYPTLIGLTTFLIGNITNPYLAKFDFMWTIFFPLTLINSWMIETDRRNKQD